MGVASASCGVGVFGFVVDQRKTLQNQGGLGVLHRVTGKLALRDLKRNYLDKLPETVVLKGSSSKWHSKRRESPSVPPLDVVHKLENKSRLREKAKACSEIALLLVGW